MIGSIIPSIVTIFANGISLRQILTIRNSIHEHSSVFRRTDETRRVIVIITIECLLGVLNSWFVDIVLSIKYCGRSVAIGDDCPNFLRRYHPLLVFFDLLNSMSNIILYCFAAKRFRHELEQMFQTWIFMMKKCLPYGSVCLRQSSIEMKHSTADEDRNSRPSDKSHGQRLRLKRKNKKDYDYIELEIVTSPESLF